MKNGFSLLELLVVLVILGIMAAAVAPLIPDGIELRARGEQVAMDLRFTQAAAMNRATPTQLVWVDAVSYRIQNSASEILATGLLADNPNNQVTFANAFVAIGYDADGIPWGGGALTLTDGPQSLTLRITPQTGTVVMP